MEKDKASLVMKSLREGRVILTRDSKMSRFTGTRMVKIKSDFVEKQLFQLVKELDLALDKSDLFKRCIICDEKLENIKKDSVKDIVPKYVFETQSIFMRCPKCKKVYWQGSHWALVNKFLDRLRGE